MKAAIIIAVALLTAGCGDAGAGDRRFYRDGATQAEFNRDAFDCEGMTRMAVPRAFGWSVASQMEGADFFLRCMSARGYAFR